MRDFYYKNTIHSFFLNSLLLLLHINYIPYILQSHLKQSEQIERELGQLFYVTRLINVNLEIKT